MHFVVRLTRHRRGSRVEGVLLDNLEDGGGSTQAPVEPIRLKPSFEELAIDRVERASIAVRIGLGISTLWLEAFHPSGVEVDVIRSGNDQTYTRDKGLLFYGFLIVLFVVEVVFEKLLTKP